MNAPFHNRNADLAAKEIANIAKLIKALETYRAEVTRRMDPTATRAQVVKLDVCAAAIALVDDGDFMAEREFFCGELGCDEDGLPFGSDGPSIGSEWPGNAVMGMR